MENTKNLMSMAASVWAPLTAAPIASVQGSGLPFAGYGMATAALQHTTDVRPDATGLPPRGRQH